MPASIAINQTLYFERLFTGSRFVDNVAVTIVDGKIIEMSVDTQVDNQVSSKQIKGLAVPGFIDVQVNGGGGVLFNDAPTVASIGQIAAAHAQFGTCGLLPTLITDKVDVMAQAANAVAEAIASGDRSILGIHFEGPHLSVAKKGVHSEQLIRSITDAEFEVLLRKDIGIRVVTVAPENVAIEDIRTLVNDGVKVCLGHSNADYDTVLKALAAGASGFTHLFNAMSAMQSREPGMVGAALADDNSWCGLILDGHHVATGSAKVALKAKGADKIMLVTDAMPPVGTQMQSFPFFGTEVHRSGNRLNVDSGALAGSVLDMASAVKYCINHVEASPQNAYRMASTSPAAFLGLDKMLGQLKVGFDASFVVLDEQHSVSQTWIAGENVFKRK